MVEIIKNTTILAGSAFVLYISLWGIAQLLKVIASFYISVCQQMTTARILEDLRAISKETVNDFPVLVEYLKRAEDFKYYDYKPKEVGRWHADMRKIYHAMKYKNERNVK